MENVLIRDKKRVKSGGLVSLTSFAFAALVKVPILLCVLLPLGLVLSAVQYPFRLLFGGDSKRKSNDVDQSDYYTLPEVDVEKRIPLADRKYDLVLFGVTGFTGRLAASYVAKTYSSSALKWAIAGRRAERLEKIRKELADECGSANLASDIDIIVADTSNEESLHNLVSNTRVVVTSVGPFALYGTPVVKFCVAYGTNYADTTGEVDWVRQMIYRFHDDAQRTGARIVSLCGNDCIPWDLSAMLLSEKLKAKSETNVKAFEFYNDQLFQTSGGTLNTVLASLSGKRRKFGDGDPLNTLPDGTMSDRRAKNKSLGGIKYSKTSGQWHSLSFLAAANMRCVQRSNALLGYGQEVTYKEQVNEPNWFTGAVGMINGLQTGIFLIFKPYRHLAYSLGFIPRPGQGPSTAFMEKAYLRVHGFAFGEDGTEVDGYIYYSRDAGYMETARMVVESGLCMALESEKLPGEGGFFTPAAGLGHTLKDRLEKTGTEFQF
mmetsp:Transcript_6628/g.8667  ORF Transcript_6628/g.8667 Transcript_6628/m.8667 type:complete len:490 (+) Transcript_6628:385-1854(+)|eukprot:CAMPEP_0204875398 /NCGR_PEP_ID=MMETSP1348-20121228/45805_1 /ASSEMBLY_ACC=CAM_ASM_000700 /TAXON_ID=215587 /ORGANISM="Aplanochytrium stocchinoi, Strain GSBS06" /LENGTH=489 /DNA_ID=CAMNT_0052031799 /DNA_START=376 /DNA_END=1845 /DNA_ORIENTATION=-